LLAEPDVVWSRLGIHPVGDDTRSLSRRARQKLLLRALMTTSRGRQAELSEAVSES
jgi:hypothetical protein